MSLSPSDFAHVLLALAMLMVAAHGLGHVFARFRQPRVVGEILGGLMLGPTLLGALVPSVQKAVFPDSPATMHVLGAVYQIGLLLLMFCSGVEFRPSFQRAERRTVAAIAMSGTLVPFALGVLFLEGIVRTGFRSPGALQGEAANDLAFLLVFAIAIAVTSIPVISRILLDLGIIETPFARIVLGAAVIEDILLYVVLAIALGLVSESHGGLVGLPALAGLEPQSRWGGVYHLMMPLAFIGVSLSLGPMLFQRVSDLRFNLVRKSSPIAFLLVFLFFMTGLCIFLGIAPIFGAFVAGMVAGTGSEDPSKPREAIRKFSFAFFIPVYFAVVGLQLDLLRGFDPLFFLAFLVFACGAKSLSVYGGARLAGERPGGARNLAVAMNARGGPGIVLASVSYDARIVSEEFYAALVMLAVVTSLLAGSWLERVVAAKRPLR